MESLKTPKFRGDIELLRGVAVLLVVIFHLKLGTIKSGFIGVDVFFVISGFLMAAAFSDPSSGLLEFYERRARRVLPAAIAIFFIFFLISPFLFLPFETEKVSESFLSTILLSPNIGFWLENGYFDEFTFRPMLHYWSLGVEFQFYLLFPLIVLFLGRNKASYIILFFVSLLLSLLLTKFSSKSAFFLFPSRLWEFLVGYGAYQLCSNSEYSIPKMKLANAVAKLALVSLLALSAFSIPQSEFPGYYALLPTALAFVFIIFGLSNPDGLGFGVGRILRYFGKISYSIYLIHYPVIFIFIYAPFSDWKKPTLTDTLLICVITFVLSVLSFRYLESPFRSRRIISTLHFTKLMVVFFFLSMLSIFIFWKFDYFSSRYSLQEQKIFYAVNDREGWFCSYSEKLKAYNQKSCRLNNLSSNRIFLLVGDSHMDAIKHLFINKASDLGVGVRMVRESCVLGVGNCSADSLLSEAKRNKITDLVLHGYKPSRFDLEELSKLLASAEGAGVSVHFITPVPTYSKSIPELLFYVWNKKADLNNYLYSREKFHVGMSPEFLRFLRDNKVKKNVFFYDPTEYLCESICKIQGEDGIFYHDSHHLSLVGARQLAPMVEAIFSKDGTWRN